MGLATHEIYTYCRPLPLHDALPIAEMLWLCRHCPRRPAEALGLNDRCDAVTEQRGASRWLITAAPAARIGTPLGTALSLQPQLRAYARSSKAEHAALLQLAHWIYRYGSPVHAEISEADRKRVE